MTIFCSDEATSGPLEEAVLTALGNDQRPEDKDELTDQLLEAGNVGQGEDEHRSEDEAQRSAPQGWRTLSSARSESATLSGEAAEEKILVHLCTTGII